MNEHYMASLGHPGDRECPVNCKTLLQNVLLVLGSLVIASLLAEMLLRVVLPPPIIWKFPQERYLSDPEISHRLKPNQLSFTHNKTVNINSHGIRDIEYSSIPSAQVTRILALGDSQTFGNGIAIAETWPKQLEHRLNGRSGTGEYEVLNGGLPASDTWQHEIILQRLMSAYNPHIVVLALYVNDIVSKPALIRDAQADVVTSGGSKLVYLLKQSVLLLSMKSAYDTVMHSISPRKGFMIQNAVLAGKSSPEIDRRWEQVERSLLIMKNITSEKNVGFLVISLPRRDQVDGRLPAEEFNKRLSTVISRTKVKYMSLLAPLQHAYKEHGKSLFIPWDGHNTSVANSIIADEIVDAVSGMVGNVTGLAGR